MPPEAREPRPQLSHEGGPAAGAGEMRLGVHLGQCSGVGRPNGGLWGSGDLQAAGPQLGAHVVDGDRSRFECADKSCQLLFLGGHRQRRPAAVGRHHRRGRTGGVESRIEHDALELPGDTGTDPRRRSEFDHALELEARREFARGRAELREEEGSVVCKRIGATRVGVDRSRSRAGAAGPPHGVVGPPPLDGVDKTPPVLEGACRGRYAQPLFAYRARRVDEPEMHRAQPSGGQPFQDGALFYRVAHGLGRETVSALHGSPCASGSQPRRYGRWHS